MTAPTAVSRASCLAFRPVAVLHDIHGEIEWLVAALHGWHQPFAVHVPWQFLCPSPPVGPYGPLGQVGARHLFGFPESSLIEVAAGIVGSPVGEYFSVRGLHFLPHGVLGILVFWFLRPHRPARLA